MGAVNEEVAQFDSTVILGKYQCRTIRPLTHTPPILPHPYPMYSDQWQRTRWNVAFHPYQLIQISSDDKPFLAQAQFCFTLRLASRCARSHARTAHSSLRLAVRRFGEAAGRGGTTNSPGA